MVPAVQIKRPRRILSHWRAKRMSRSAIGFLAGVGYCFAANILMFVAFLRINSPTVCVVTWWIVNFPSIPFLWALAKFFPPPTDDAAGLRWDYFMWAVGAFCACCIWGVFGTLVARLSRRRANSNLIANMD
jgi:hypothetical protein